MRENLIKLALIQTAALKTADENLNHIKHKIKEAVSNNAGLILLQELHNTPYFCIEENPDNFDLAETIPGKSTDFLSAIASEYKVVIVASLFEKRAKGLYHNTAVVFDSDGTVAGKYRKMHIPDDPGFYEKYYFTPGDLGFTPIKTSLGKLGVLICWDQWFPEAARLMCLAGADILLYPTAIGWDPEDTEEEQCRQLEAWITIQRSHAIANGVPLASCNRTGTETSSSVTTRFWGNSFVCGPQGEILTQLNDSSDCNLYANIDLSRTEAVRKIWPYFRDRRIDDYDKLTQRFIDDDTSSS